MWRLASALATAAAPPFAASASGATPSASALASSETLSTLGQPYAKYMAGEAVSAETHIINGLSAQLRSRRSGSWSD